MRRTCVVLLVLSCSGDDSHRQATMHPRVAPIVSPAPTVAPPPAPAATRLSEDMAKPYFTTGDAALGAAAYADERWDDARVAFGKARAAATGVDAARLDVMIGLSNAAIRDWAPAAKHLVDARAGLPLLADYLGYHAARAQYFAKQGAAALELATSVAADSIVGAEAELLAGDVIRGMGDAAKTAAHYQGYLTRRPSGMRRSEARFYAAEALEKSSRDQAVALYRQIGIDDPLSSWTTRANARLQAMAVTPAPLTAAEHLTRGMELFDSMRNPESEAAFDTALADPAISIADRCDAAYHRAQSRFKARDRRGAAPMFDDAAAACKAAANADLEIKSRYQAGRSYAFVGQHKEAVERYQAAQQVDPEHSYSDDALLREAEGWASLGDAKKVEATLSALPKRFPKGDNVAEAMWRLGWRAWREKRYPDAIKWWKQQIALVPHDDNYFGEGQAPYWLGRAYLATGKQQAAIAAWEQGIQQYPAAYYALLALNRIRELAPKRYEKLVASLAAAPAGFDPAAPAFTFAPRPEWGTPGFARAMELLRLGLGTPAAAELGKLGLTAPAGKQRVDDAELIEKLWAMAFLYDRAGRYATSHWPTRWHILDYRKQWPVGANRARWEIAYPRAYEELLARHAKINDVPFAMQIGIVREESAFDPRTESYANAWGLTQMIPPTAKDYGKGTGIAPTRENMFDPEKNVTVGSRFLGSLFKRYDGFTALVPPGYNAGPGYVRRVLRARGTLDTDEFVEAIVDDQVRNYSKRVLGTYFTYSWLYGTTVPMMPNQIPTTLLPK